MFSKIKNPKTGRMVLLNGRIGRQILKKHITALIVGNSLVGGASEKSIVGFRTATWCGPCNNFKVQPGGDDAYTIAGKILQAGHKLYWVENNGKDTIHADCGPLIQEAVDDENKASLSNVISNFNNTTGNGGAILDAFINKSTGYPTILKYNPSSGEFDMFNKNRTWEDISTWLKADFQPDN